MMSVSARPSTGYMPHVEGVVKLAYPLERTPRSKTVQVYENPLHVGYGPCAETATSVMAIVLESPNYERSLVYFYDQWAKSVEHIKSKYKMKIQGRGVVQFMSTAGQDTEEPITCYVVAEKRLLKHTMEKLGERETPFALPTGVAIAVEYQEAQEIPGTHQVYYVESKVIRGADLYAERKTITPEAKSKRAKSSVAKRGKRKLDLMSSTQTKYSYVQIADLQEGDAHLYGVVVNLTLPKMARNGFDFYISMHIVDESCKSRELAMPVNIFSKKTCNLPPVMFIGDIIRFHRLPINTFRERHQGIGKPPKTRYVIFRENDDGSINPIASTENYAYTDSDRERIQALQKFKRELLAHDDTLPAGCPNHPIPLTHVKSVEDFGDILVRVLAVQIKDNYASLIVWDGSGDTSSPLHDDLFDQIPSNVEKPSHGMLMELFVDSCWHVMEKVGFARYLTKYWCRFRNIAVEEDEEVRRGSTHFHRLFFREVSSIMFVPDYDIQVQKRTKSAVVLPSKKVATTVPPFVLEKTDVTSLELVRQATVVPRKYHCLVQVTQRWPEQVQDLTKLKDGRWVYSFVLRLRDESDALDVIVHGTDAEQFMHGIPPCDLSTNSSSRSLVQDRLDTLIRSATSVHCCLKSYHPTFTTGSNPSVRYRLFDTTLHYH